MSSSSSLSVESSVFDSYGVLEHILSFADMGTVVSATLVCRRWKEAGRQDEIWRIFVRHLWDGKKCTQPVLLLAAAAAEGSGVVQDPVFWRALFTKDVVSRMSEVQIRSIFNHPLLPEKRSQIQDCHDEIELRRFLQVHMLDVMSEDDDYYQSDSDHCHRPVFFSDLYFGSYASAVKDSTRDKITPAELCTPHGFHMFFKISEEDVDEEDRQHLMPYKDGVLLYPYSTGFFEESRSFHIDTSQIPQSYHPANLKWTWIEVGKQVQVGPYPPLTASRSNDWGWKLENLHVVLIYRDG